MVEIETDWKRAKQYGNVELARLIAENSDSFKVLKDPSWETLERLPALNLDLLVVYHLPNSVKKQQKMVPIARD